MDLDGCEIATGVGKQAEYMCRARNGTQVTTTEDQEADDNIESSVEDWKERSEDCQCKTKLCNAGAGVMLMLNEDQLMQVQNELVN